jgi:hypothetical protein
MTTYVVVHLYSLRLPSRGYDRLIGILREPHHPSQRTGISMTQSILICGGDYYSLMVI